MIVGLVVATVGVLVGAFKGYLAVIALVVLLVLIVGTLAR